MAGTIALGEDLLQGDSGSHYYFEQMKLALQNNPNLAPDKNYDDDEIKNLAVRSAWRCGDYALIAFLWYCPGDITYDGNTKSCDDAVQTDLRNKD